jgi:hypothetical protein
MVAAQEDLVGRDEDMNLCKRHQEEPLEAEEVAVTLADDGLVNESARSRREHEAFLGMNAVQALLKGMYPTAGRTSGRHTKACKLV